MDFRLGVVGEGLVVVSIVGVIRKNGWWWFEGTKEKERNAEGVGAFLHSTRRRHRLIYIQTKITPTRV